MNRTTLFARSANKIRIEEQLTRCRQVASNKGLPFESASIVIDTCRRAALLTKRRPIYQQLLASIRRGACDLVVVDSLIVLTSDIEEFADLWILVMAGTLRIVTVDGVDTGWRSAP